LIIETVNIDKKIIYSFNEIPKNSKICIYSIRPLEQSFANLIKIFRKDIEILCFLDSSQIGEIANIKIIKIDEFIKSDIDYDLILIPASLAREKLELLNGLKVKYKLIDTALTYTCFYYFKDIPEYNHISNNIYLNNKEHFQKVEDILKNEVDKNLYRNLIDLRLNPNKLDEFRKNFYINTENISKQYYDYINKSQIKIMIEGGVCDGGSAYKFQTSFPKLNKLYGFEPFKKIYNDNIYVDVIDKNIVNVFPLALWEEKTTLEFKNEGGASRVASNEDGLVKVDAISLDEFVKENNIKKVDYIKLDTEGSELNVLKGGINTLIMHRPQLAISIYHKYQDMYSIPIFLDNILENYTFRLGHYSFILFETVFYAIPNELAESKE